MCSLVSDVAQVESGGGIQVDDPAIARHSTNPPLADSILKGHESHEKKGSRKATANLKSLLLPPARCLHLGLQQSPNRPGRYCCARRRGSRRQLSADRVCA